ncbi:hypothetical protein Sme01_36200 [Sphaerisporangium melleum]|uniref:Restriction endonuclease type II NotI domain-containing protein n=1 Tax=Sphaerisporangium melleum TaxID=321316 RepID=A0A917VUI7_9ACTN|nr:hypothetical protein [Sphaerisporangium melleum]GGL19088.1 hypothetical protein GCM10007964_71380 [Sphaerisporangium melleum]GII71144.1 hypothetical protein Sme01_36200 [Sphaerisporangium melleum]
MTRSLDNSTPRTTRKAGNHIAEWFGHRVFPVVAATEASLNDQQSKRCPFLSDLTGELRDCVKPLRSHGVCTISSVSNGPRQDWLVCPIRALDSNLLEDAARRLFGHDASTPINIVAAPVLRDIVRAQEFRQAVISGVPSLVYFHAKLGGEISISPTERSPQFSFDATVVEVRPAPNGSIAVGRYGIFEIQTMDFHGSYSHAVQNLNSALHLHSSDFGPTVYQHPEWLSEKVEGPNISNVFKRTFYQMMFKFHVGSHGQSAGCVFAIPSAVWDSWQRHLGKPDLVGHGDGTFRLAMPDQVHNETPSAWIYVFDLDVSTDVTPNEINLVKIIGTDAEALAHFALEVAPQAALEQGGSVDLLLDSIRGRLSQYLPELKTAPGQTML